MAAKNVIDNYISGFPKEVQIVLEEMKSIIKKEAPAAEETIGYGIPTFKLNGNLIHFAGYKNHVGFYPTPSVIKAFEKELSLYKTSKGAVQFSLNEPLPSALIKKIVQYRVNEVSLKKSTKTSKKTAVKSISKK